MASTRYATFSSSLLSPYFTVHVGWDDLGDGGWTPLNPDDQVSRPSADLPLQLSYRLYCKGRVLGHKRGKRNTRPNTSLLQIEGVVNKEDAQFYLGKVLILPSLILCADLWHSRSV